MSTKEVVSEQPRPTYVYGFAAVFLAEALRCQFRCEAAAKDSTVVEVAGAAAAAVLMAVAAIEASLSEYSTYLSVPSSDYRHLSQADVALIRDGNESLHTRYQRLINFYSPAVVCDTREPFKDLRCLVELRNSIAHRRAAFLVPGEWPEGLKECRRRIPYHKDGVHDWTSVVLIPEVAEWAVDRTSAFFDWVRPLMPTLSVRVQAAEPGTAV